MKRAARRVLTWVVGIALSKAALAHPQEASPPALPEVARLGTTRVRR
jgi:hypothetical protein